MSNGPVTSGLAKAKAWWKSKTIIGIIIMVAQPILGLFGVDLDLGNVIESVFLEGEALAGMADQLWDLATELFGAILATYGRLKAKVGIKGAANSFDGPIGGGGSNPKGGNG